MFLVCVHAKHVNYPLDPLVISHGYWEMAAFIGDLPFGKWWFSIAMINCERVCLTRKLCHFRPHFYGQGGQGPQLSQVYRWQDLSWNELADQTSISMYITMIYNLSRESPLGSWVILRASPQFSRKPAHGRPVVLRISLAHELLEIQPEDGDGNWQQIWGRLGKDSLRFWIQKSYLGGP